MLSSTIPLCRLTVILCPRISLGCLRVDYHRTVFSSSSTSTAPVHCRKTCSTTKDMYSDSVASISCFKIFSKSLYWLNAGWFFSLTYQLSFSDPQTPCFLNSWLDFSVLASMVPHEVLGKSLPTRAKWHLNVTSLTRFSLTTFACHFPLALVSKTLGFLHHFINKYILYKVLWALWRLLIT